MQYVGMKCTSIFLLINFSKKRDIQKDNNFRMTLYEHSSQCRHVSYNDGTSLIFYPKATWLRRRRQLRRRKRLLQSPSRGRRRARARARKGDKYVTNVVTEQYPARGIVFYREICYNIYETTTQTLWDSSLHSAERRQIRPRYAVRRTAVFFSQLASSAACAAAPRPSSIM